MPRLQLTLQTSVIREGLRLSYGVTTRLPRIAHHDIQYGEHVIPAGVCYRPGSAHLPRQPLIARRHPYQRPHTSS